MELFLAQHEFMILVGAKYQENSRHTSCPPCAIITMSLDHDLGSDWVAISHLFRALISACIHLGQSF